MPRPDAIQRWLRGRDPRPETAPVDPLAMAAALDAAPAAVAARLLPHTLARLRPCDPSVGPWLRAAGCAAWRGLLRLAAQPDPMGLVAARCKRLSDALIGEDLFLGLVPPLTPIGLRLADAAGLHLGLAAVRGRSDLATLAERIAEQHRRELIADLGPDPGGRAQVPRRDASAVTVTADGLLLHCPPLAPVAVVAQATHWRLLGAGTHLGDAPPNARLRIAAIAVAHWAKAWRTSPHWLPPGHAVDGLPRALLRLLSGELPRLCLRLGMNGSPGVWTRTLAARLREPLATAATARFAPAVLAVWRRLGAVAPFPPTASPLGLAVEPAFWAHPFLSGDVRRLRGAATVVRCLCTNPGYEADERAEHALAHDRLLQHGWLALCSPQQAPASRALRVTLASCPGGLPLCGWPITLLGAIDLPRPRTTRLELLAALVVARRRRSGQRSVNDGLLLQAADGELRAVLRTLVAQGRLASLRSAIRIAERLADWLDCPERAGTVAALARRSARWHQRFPPVDDIFAPTPRLPPETALAALPVALPTAPAPGVSLRLLASVGELAAEGARMRHCVASYAHKAAQGLCHILHIDTGGESATVELDRHLAIVQAKGPGNARNAATIWAERHLPGLIAQARQSGAA